MNQQYMYYIEERKTWLYCYPICYDRNRLFLLYICGYDFYIYSIDKEYYKTTFIKDKGKLSFNPDISTPTVKLLRHIDCEPYISGIIYSVRLALCDPQRRSADNLIFSEFDWHTKTTKEIPISKYVCNLCRNIFSDLFEEEEHSSILLSALHHNRNRYKICVMRLEERIREWLMLIIIDICAELKTANK